MTSRTTTRRPDHDEEQIQAQMAEGSQDEADDHDRLPAIPPESQSLPGSLPRYDEIPSELSEALRGIINRYELRSGHSVPRSIAVTSALAGEGVTTVSQALATMLAHEMGRFVCWVDCGWLAARPDDDFDGSRPSLIDILGDQSRISSAFLPSPDLPQLISLSAGPVPESKRNLIVRSPQFDQLLGILADEFDHVVFDIPPVLSNANGLALLRRADVCLLVVRHRSTTLDQVRRTIEATQPTPNMGVLLNRYRTRVPARIRRLLGS